MEALPNDNLSRSALAEQFGDIAEMEQRRGSVSAQRSKMAGSNQCNVGNGRKMCKSISRIQQDLPQLGAETATWEGGTRFLDGQARKKLGTGEGKSQFQSHNRVPIK